LKGYEQGGVEGMPPPLFISNSFNKKPSKILRKWPFELRLTRVDILDIRCSSESLSLIPQQAGWGRHTTDLETVAAEPVIVGTCLTLWREEGEEEGRRRAGGR
jgi:hypothetical protein